MLLLFLSCKMFAQDFQTKSTPEERARFQTEWMKMNLKLSDNQLTQVAQVNLTYAQKIEEVKNISSKISKLKKAKSIMDEKDGVLKKILTKDQFQIYSDKKEELRNKMKEANQQRKNSKV
jgi:hypothetical protein